MASKGITGKPADEVIHAITAFALYGFPESHAASFALLAYASAYLKAHHIAAFTCALLNNQPMGFYHPFTLVKDAQRHGAVFRPVDATRSDWPCTLEDGAVRLGLRYVAGLRQKVGERIAALRAERPFASLQDMVDRADLHKDELTALAEVGALNAFGLTRRSALWQVERAARPRGPLLEDADAADATRAASPLRDMTFTQRLSADVKGTGVTVGPHPLILHRPSLASRGILRAMDLPRMADGSRVTVAGAVICRQRPGTAKGFMFLTLEDETGLVNIIVKPDQFERWKDVLVTSPVLEIHGFLQSQEGMAVRALRARPVETAQAVSRSRDFH
jgi:error-prone DNA polymerase